MLQLKTKDVNICRISKLLVKYNIKASITNEEITLDGDISDEIITKLCENININKVQNFISKETIQKEETEASKTNVILPQNTEEYDLIYPTVKRGEVYWCDFGEPYGSELGFMRPAIIVQNNNLDLNNPVTIVIPVTTKIRSKLYQGNFSCILSESMVNDDVEESVLKTSLVLTDRIKAVSKRKLRKYIGTLKPEIMEKLQENIDISLDLSREVKTIVKQEKVYVDRPIHEKTIDKFKVLKEPKDVNMTQVQLLSYVDINELLKISQSHSSDEVKAKKILELFSFDFKKKGIEYLLEAILASPKDTYFNLETLTERVSKKVSVDKEEVKRLIVARVKETFGFKKAPTIDFIRLINNFLTKQEDEK